MKHSHIVGGAILLLALACPAFAANKVRVAKSVGVVWTYTPLDVGVEEGIRLIITPFAQSLLIALSQ